LFQKFEYLQIGNDKSCSPKEYHETKNHIDELKKELFERFYKVALHFNLDHWNLEF